MTDEMNETVEQNDPVEKKDRRTDFFRKHAALIAWIPTAILCLLSAVLFLAPIGNVVMVGGDTLTGYGALIGDWMEGLKTPVMVMLAIASVSVIAGVLGIVLKKYRNSLAFDIAAIATSFSALATGVGQIAWLGSMSATQGVTYQPGAFSILAVVFGALFMLVAVGETVIHSVWIADNNQKALWKTTWGKWKGWVYLLPALVLLAIFTVWPIINTFRISMLEDYSVLAAKNPNADPFAVNFNNFKNVVQYSGFWNCLLNTVLLTVITVPISTMLALIIAVALNSIKPLRRIFQTIFFLPYVTNTIAIGMVFMAMFQMIGYSPTTEPTSVGVINTIIEAFGGTRVNWVNESSTKFANMFVLCVYIIWNALPFKILVLLGGLQGVNKQYYDAAKVDGASRWRIFWRITVPMLSPMIAYVVITGFIGGFKEYNSVVGIFGTGDLMGPPGSFGKPLNTMVGYIYDRIANNQGRASAAALILFAIIFIVTMINLYVSKKKVHY